jgi:type III secretion protein J
MRTAALCMALVLPACSVEVERDLLEEDANEIYGVLYERGFNPVKQREEGEASRYAIAVAKADVGRAQATLSRHGLPRVRQPGFELVGVSHGLQSPAEEHAVLLEAISGEVANVIARLPAMLDARVIVNVPPQDELDRAPAAPSASVYLRYRGALGVSEDDVRRFVASAVPSLKTEQVSIVAVATPDTADPVPSGELLSASALKAMVGVLAGLLMLTAAMLGVLLRRHRAMGTLRRVT